MNEMGFTWRKPKEISALTFKLKEMRMKLAKEKQP